MEADKNRFPFLPMLFVLTQLPMLAQQKLELFFNTDAAELTAIHKSKIDRLLQQDATITSVEAYCDYRGSVSYNDSLSARRSTSVVNYLKEKSQTPDATFPVENFGERHLQDHDLAKNRKAVILYEKPKGFSEKITSAKIGEKIRLENLNFLNMSAKLVSESQPVLDNLLKIMQENPKLHIDIQGHICCQTTYAKTYEYVSADRAKAVYNFLIDNGIDTSRLSYQGFGVSRPLHKIPEQSEKEAYENRRVEIEILEN